MTKLYFYEELKPLLKVNPPLFMLDKLYVDPDKKSADGIKQVTMNDTVFQGHFPGQPVLPGVLQVAAMAQASKVLFMTLYPGENTPVVVSFRKVKFRTPVVPGMTLRISTEASTEGEDGKVEFQIKNYVNGDELASSAYITFQRKPEGWFTPLADEGEAPFMAEADKTKIMSPIAIMEHIPHRFPFMLVDGAYGLDDVEKVIGFKNVTCSDPLVQAANPSAFPCYLQIEAGAQLGCAAMLAQPENKGLLGFFMSIDKAEFLRPVLPGDKMTMKIVCEPRGKFGIATGEFYVGSTLAANAEIKFALVPKA